MRILLIDRLRTDLTRIRDALRSEKRFDLNEVNIQPDAPITANQREFLDLDSQAYDVIIIGNVTANELLRIDPGILQKISRSGEETGNGTHVPRRRTRLQRHARRTCSRSRWPRGRSSRTWTRGRRGRSSSSRRSRPTNGLAKMMKVAKEQKDSVALWNELNGFRSRAKITGFNRMVKKETGTVYAWASNALQPVTAGTAMPANANPLLVGHQIGDGARGRVLAFAAYDTFLWEKLGQPKSQRRDRDSHALLEEVRAVAGPPGRGGGAGLHPPRASATQGRQRADAPARGQDSLGGGDDPNAELTVKIVPLPEGKAEPDPAELDRAKPETVIRDKDGAKVLYRPRARGEYFAVLTSPKKDADGKPIIGPDGKPELLRATAKFIAIPDTSDEMLRSQRRPRFHGAARQHQPAARRCGSKTCRGSSRN